MLYIARDKDGDLNLFCGKSTTLVVLSLKMLMKLENMQMNQEKIDKSKDIIREIQIASLENMNPWESEDDIPEIPIMNSEDYEKYVVHNFIRCGAIPKNKLKIGAEYLGSCRNTDKAKWDGEKFIYTRNKFGLSYEAKIKHFEDNDEFDMFIPWIEK